MEAATQPQHLRALENANRVRRTRAALRRQIGDGEKLAAEVIAEPTDETRTWELFDVLTAQRRWGRARARRLLLGLGLSEQKRIGTLTPRQRKTLVEALAPKETAEDVLARLGLS